MDDVEALLSVKDSVDSLLSVEALPASVYVPDSIVEVQPAVEDSIYVEVSASGEAPQEVPVSVIEVPDSVEGRQCARCGTLHAGSVFSEACFHARRNARRCARCGLMHEDYDLSAQMLHDQVKFECEIYIPNMRTLRSKAAFLGSAISFDRWKQKLRRTPDSGNVKLRRKAMFLAFK